MDAPLGTYPSFSLLTVRVFLGIIFFAHGAQKVFGWFGGNGPNGLLKSPLSHRLLKKVQMQGGARRAE